MKTTFEEFKEYINSYEVGTVIYRKELNRCCKHGRIDNYRNYSCHAGYLKWIKRGFYEISKHFPEGFTTSNLMKEAYPNSEWTKKYKTWKTQKWITDL